MENNQDQPTPDEQYRKMRDAQMRRVFIGSKISGIFLIVFGVLFAGGGYVVFPGFFLGSLKYLSFAVSIILIVCGIFLIKTYGVKG